MVDKPAGRATDKWAHYLTPTATHRQLGLACLGVGRQRDFVACPPRVLDCYAAVFVAEGQGWLRAAPGQPTQALNPPVLFWLFPGVEHTYGPARQGWLEMWTLFEGSAAPAFERLGYLTRARPVVPLADPRPVRHALEGLLQICRDQHPGFEVATTCRLHELILAAQRIEADPDDGPDASILAALRDRACGPESVGEHARHFGLSVNALRRVVQRRAGCAPKEYILRIRLNHAKRLLAESELTIAQVARRVGHDDPAYFTRIFTQRTGSSPRAFRHQQRRGG